MGHPQKTTAVLSPQVRIEPFENCAIVDQIHHLGLALKIFEAGGFAELGFQRLHKAGDIAVSAEMPVMIGDDIAEGPSILGRQHGLQTFEGG